MACFAYVNQMWLVVNHNTLVSHLANEFDVRSILLEQVGLAAVNHNYVNRGYER